MKNLSQPQQIFLILYAFFCILFITLIPGTSQTSSKTGSEIWIRDPNIIFWKGTYYLTGTTAENGFYGYSSTDLIHWDSHGYIYTKNASNYWAQKNFWAPEMVEFNGKFYLFYTAIAEGLKRRTGVAIADQPMGPYTDLMQEPLTPSESHCLDGHFFQHPNGSLYFYYVFEWINNGTGEMWMQEISSDLTHLLGRPVSLFQGGSARWSNAVIDGPSMIFKNDRYFLFWSSFNSYNDGKYCVGVAESLSPLGPFVQSHNPVIWEDGGHSTWFIENATEQRKIVYHQPNGGPERLSIKTLDFNDESKIWTVEPQENIPFIWEDYWLHSVLIGIPVGMGVVILILKLKRKKVKNGSSTV